MDNQDVIDAALIQGYIDRLPRWPWREAFIRSMIHLGLRSKDSLEFRLSSEDSDDIVEVAQRAANVFFSAFEVYPVAIAVHPVVAACFEEARVAIWANHRLGVEFEVLLVDFEPALIPIESDESLDARTVAVRFALDDKEYSDAMNKVLRDTLAEVKRGAQ